MPHRATPEVPFSTRKPAVRVAGIVPRVNPIGLAPQGERILFGLNCRQTCLGQLERVYATPDDEFSLESEPPVRQLHSPCVKKRDVRLIDR